MFNSVYSLAGPACVVNTVEQMSGVRVDHFVEVDFAGFKGLVDALGGVTVTLDKPMSSTKGGLKLDAGSHRLNGTDSLKFVRTRYGYGDGSDLGRIGLQQQFMMAMLSEIKKQDALGNPARLYKLADAGTKRPLAPTTRDPRSPRCLRLPRGRYEEGRRPGHHGAGPAPVRLRQGGPEPRDRRAAAGGPVVGGPAHRPEGPGLGEGLPRQGLRPPAAYDAAGPYGFPPVRARRVMCGRYRRSELRFWPTLPSRLLR